MERIPWAPMYLVSRSGHVYSTFRGGMKKKATMRHSGGYLQVHLKTTNGYRIVKIHTIVAELYLPPCPEGCYLIRHWDDDPTNNDYRNLFWGTQVENQTDNKRNGGQCGRPSVISDDIVRKIKTDRANGVPGVIVSAKYGVSQSMVSNIFRGSRRKDTR